MGLEFMGDVPFRQVYIHGLVRDADRQKMSKTRGNVVDPLVVTEKYGTDAVRMALLQGAAPGTDIVLTEERMESSRAFANKIWNAARFLFLNMERSGVEPWVPVSLESFLAEADGASLEVPIEDRWIFSRLNNCAEQVNRAVENYRYHEAAQMLWHFFWHEFCDWYLELKKLRFQEGSGLNAGWRNTLAAFETALRLLHPAMPFLTEELWQRVATDRRIRPVSIAVAPYPQYRQDVTDYEAEREVEKFQEVVTSARTQRAYAKADPKKQLRAKLYARDFVFEVAQRHAEALRRLTNMQVEMINGPPPREAGPSAAVAGELSLSGDIVTARYSGVGFDWEIQVPQSQPEAQRKRIEKEREQLVKNISNSERQLSDDVFLSKAPVKVVESIRQKLANYQEQLRVIDSVL
jgi:valyl-tRNA synthetase